jgi:hypothetical protein
VDNRSFKKASYETIDDAWDGNIGDGGCDKWWSEARRSSSSHFGY